MKKNKKSLFSYILIGLSIVGLSSCSDYLSELPDNRTEIDSNDKISELLTGAYPDGNYMPIAFFMSDNADDKTNLSATENLHLNLYSLETPVDDQQDSPIHYWNAAYKAIAQANQALKSIEELRGNSTDDPILDNNERSLDEMEGEGLLARAYAHFMLVNLWSEHYDPATASTQLGIPYVTEPETELLVDYERNSVQETYDLIEKDIENGLALVTDNYEHPKYHFNLTSGKAFAVRFYLYKGDWDKVIEYANQILTSPEQKLRDWLSYQNLQYSETANQFSNTTEPANIMLAYTSSVYSRSYASSRFALSSDKLDELFSQGAGNPYGKAWAYIPYGTDFVYNFPKFQEYFEYTNVNAGIGFVHVPVVLFSYDEILLARAEAYTMKDQFDNSLDDINLFLSKRTEGYNASTDVLTESDMQDQYPVIPNEYTPYYSLSSEQSSFVKGIAELRRREFYFEGLRWFDIKRFHIEYTHTFADQNDITIEKDDNRRLLQIPLNAIATGIEANPR